MINNPGALDLYPDKIHNKLIFSEKVLRVTYVNIVKVPLGDCVKQSILAQFYFVIYHFNWFYGQ